MYTFVDHVTSNVVDVVTAVGNQSVVYVAVNVELVDIHQVLGIGCL